MRHEEAPALPLGNAPFQPFLRRFCLKVMISSMPSFSCLNMSRHAEYRHRSSSQHDGSLIQSGRPVYYPSDPPFLICLAVSYTAEILSRGIFLIPQKLYSIASLFQTEAVQRIPTTQASVHSAHISFSITHSPGRPQDWSGLSRVVLLSYCFRHVLFL